MLAAALLTVTAALGGGGHAAAVPAPTPDVVQRVGRSVQGRAITVTRRGPAPTGEGDAIVDVLVVGSIHGNERAGEAVVAQLRRGAVPAGVRLWLVTSANPDGTRAGTRQNAHGVDLNRNFPHRWIGGGQPFDTFYPGRAASSEPETRALQALVVRVQPNATVWYHQHADLVVRPERAFQRCVAGEYARVADMRLRPWEPLRGTAIGWQGAAQPASVPLVVELPAGRLAAIDVRRHVRAVAGVASAVADRATCAPPE